MTFDYDPKRFMTGNQPDLSYAQAVGRGLVWHKGEALRKTQNRYATMLPAAKAEADFAASSLLLELQGGK